MKIFLMPVLRWLVSLPWTDFIRIVGVVGMAAEKHKKPPHVSDGVRKTINAYRSDHVRDFMFRHFPRLSGWQANVVLELAVAYVNRKK